MLTPLRKIRKSLIGTSTTRKYLLYAMGEILLVMIGILLALQVNNWNVHRQQRQLEISTLLEIKMALAQDTSRVVQVLEELHYRRGIIIGLIDHVEAKKPFDSTMKRSFILGYSAHTPILAKFNKTAFDLLKERGMDIITNPELRRKISEHYNVTHPVNEGWFSNLKDVWRLESNRLYDHFKITVESDNNITMNPKDYGELLDSEEMMYPFHHFNALLFNSIKFLVSFSDASKEVLRLIEEELEDK